MDILKKWGFTGVLVTLFFAVTSYIFFNESSRSKLRKPFELPERRIISVASGRIFPEKKIGRVLKVETPEGISVEIYGEQNDSPETLIDRFVLKNHRDAQVQFQARATSLALKDMNGDNVFEIIVPTSDAKLNSHLTVYSFQPMTGHFVEYTE